MRVAGKHVIKWVRKRREHPRYSCVIALLRRLDRLLRNNERGHSQGGESQKNAMSMVTLLRHPIAQHDTRVHRTHARAPRQGVVLRTSILL